MNEQQHQKNRLYLDCRECSLVNESKRDLKVKKFQLTWKRRHPLPKKGKYERVTLEREKKIFVWKGLEAHIGKGKEPQSCV